MVWNAFLHDTGYKLLLQSFGGKGGVVGAEKYERVVRALHSAYQGAEVLWLRENFGNLSAPAKPDDANESKAQFVFLLHPASLTATFRTACPKRKLSLGGIASPIDA